MLRSMLTASTTLNQLQQQIDTISSNLSNSNTTGYKAKDTNFSELVRQQFDQVDEKTRKWQKPENAARLAPWRRSDDEFTPSL